MSTKSRVNFNFLNEAEQVERYKNMLREYHSLKKGISLKVDEHFSNDASIRKKRQMMELKEGDFSLCRARAVLRKREHEIEDCGEVLDSLASCLASRKLEGESVEFGLIHALIGKVKRRTKRAKENEPKPTRRLKKFLKRANKEDILEVVGGEPAGKHAEKKVSQRLTRWTQSKGESGKEGPRWEWRTVLRRQDPGAKCGQPSRK